MLYEPSKQHAQQSLVGFIGLCNFLTVVVMLRLVAVARTVSVLPTSMWYIVGLIAFVCGGYGIAWSLGITSSDMARVLGLWAGLASNILVQVVGHLIGYRASHA